MNLQEIVIAANAAEGQVAAILKELERATGARVDAVIVRREYNDEGEPGAVAGTKIRVVLP